MFRDQHLFLEIYSNTPIFLMIFLVFLAFSAGFAIYVIFSDFSANKIYYYVSQLSILGIFCNNCYIWNFFNIFYDFFQNFWDIPSQ